MFMSERRVSLVVDGHQCEAVVVETEVPRGLPVSHILFAIYLSGIFKEAEEEVEGYMSTSFADDSRWLEMRDSEAQLRKRLEKSRRKACGVGGGKRCGV